MDKSLVSIENKKPGFTLMEVILYLALIAIVVTVFSSLLYLIMSSKVKAQTIREVEFQGQLIIDNIDKSIKNSFSVNSPLPGNTQASLSLNTYQVVNNPTIYSLSSNQVNVQEASNPAISLNTSEYPVTNLTFTNVANTDSPDIIKIQFTISRQNPNNRQEFNYSKNFYGTISTR